jgi:hypothetical protein
VAPADKNAGPGSTALAGRRRSQTTRKIVGSPAAATFMNDAPGLVAATILATTAAATVER